ncbi:MAG: cupin domain-containing protein [Candidatus Omnitrophica bacterium]|nr:cupin domain-containing protein [Candidatus Omnitrophota bacterium]
MKKDNATGKVFFTQLKGKQRFLRLLGNKEKDNGLRAGLVTLKPKEFIGEHKTDRKEEAIIILKGSAVVYCGKNKKIRVSQNAFIYIPPETMHNVENTGSDILQYVYVTANI